LPRAVARMSSESAACCSHTVQQPEICRCFMGILVLGYAIDCDWHDTASCTAGSIETDDIVAAATTKLMLVMQQVVT
jgi:hypothetical protein